MVWAEDFEDVSMAGSGVFDLPCPTLLCFQGNCAKQKARAEMGCRAGWALGFLRF